MHLHTVHTSSCYSAAANTTTNTTSTGPCLNVTMTSRVMRGTQSCVSAASTSNSSTAFNASTATPTHFTLHARSDFTESEGLSRGAIIAIVVIIIVLGLALTCAATCAQQRGRGRSHKHHANGAKGPAIPMQNYRSGAGLSAPPRSHGGRARAPQFPGPRNGFGAQSSRQTRNTRGPYADIEPLLGCSNYGR